MKVPINPQTRVPTGQLGYQQAVDVTAGARALGAVVKAYGEDYNQEQKKRELFDVQKILVDETNALQLDFEDRQQKAPLGAPNFVQETNDGYTARHTELVTNLRSRGYSKDAINEFETRLGTVRSTYIAKAIDFQDKSGFAKVVGDTDQMAVSLSQYAGKNPDALPSALDELKVALQHSGLDAVEADQVYENKKQIIIKGAQEGYVLQNPETILGLYGLPTELTTTSPANLPQGQQFDLPSYLVKLSPVEGTAKNKRSSAVGHFQFLDSTMIETYKQVFGKTGESDAQILAKRKDRGVMVKVAEKFTNDNIAKLVAANLPVNDATVYLSHFLGVNDALKVVSAHADETIGKLVRGAAVKANPGVFKKIQTAGDLLSWAREKFGVEVEVASPVPSIPGTIDVSKLPAVKNADGSVSTVRSISIEQDGKTYLIPTVVEGKVVSDDQAVFAFRESGEHLGVFANAHDADAYAQTLHESEAHRVGADMMGADGKTGVPVLDMSTGPERMQMLTMARTIMNGREADAKAAQSAAHSAYINDFYNQLQDGKLGQADLNTAYQKGYITNYDERKKAQGILDSKVKKETDLQRFGVMLNSRTKFNPYDDDAQKAVDAGFAKAVELEAKAGRNTSPFLISLDIWNKMGVLPKAGGTMIRGGLIGTDANTVAASASVASNMLAQNPNAFAGVEGGEDIGRAAATYAHYVDDLGMTAQEAAQKIATMNSPEFQAKIKADEPVRNKFIKLIGEKNIELTLNNAIQGPRGFLGNVTFGAFSETRGKFTEPQKAEARQTFSELALDSYDKNHDEGAAVAYATNQMKRFYGVENGRFLKFPASKAYPEIQGSREYIYDQAKEIVDAFAGANVPKEKIWLQPTASGSTANAFRAGKIAPYEIHFITERDGQEIYHYIPGKVFVADVNKARQAAGASARAVERGVRDLKTDQRRVTGLGGL